MKATIIFFLLLCSNKIFAQFEGELIYKFEITSESLKRLSEGKSRDELKKANDFYDTIKVYVKDDNFIIVKNNNFEEKNIFIESEKKVYSIFKMLLLDNERRTLTTTDLQNPVYNKDNFENYNKSSITVTDVDFGDMKCKEYLLRDSKIVEKFIISDELQHTEIVRNYLLPPFTGQNLNSEFYKPFRNKIFCFYELEIMGIRYTASLIKINDQKLDRSLFNIPKTNREGVIVD